MAEQAGEPQVGGAEEFPGWALGRDVPQRLAPAHRPSLALLGGLQITQGLFCTVFASPGTNHHSPKAVILFSIVCLRETLWFGGV